MPVVSPSPRVSQSLLLLITFLPLVQSQFLLPEFVSTSTAAPELPKGIFHYNRAETNVHNQFHIPDADLSQPMQMASELINTAVASSSSRRQALSGVKIPLPFGMAPLNLQLSQDSETRMGVSHDSDETLPEHSTAAPASERRRAPSMDARVRTALNRARHVCLHQSQSRCDKALERYHRLRFGESPAVMRERLRKAQPQDWSTYVQTGLAKWLVPGLDRKLDQVVLNGTASNEVESESESGEVEESPSPTIPPAAPHRRAPERRRVLVRLPARANTVFLPPRN